jgi:myosin heavy subunit
VPRTLLSQSNSIAPTVTEKATPPITSVSTTVTKTVTKMIGTASDGTASLTPSSSTRDFTIPRSLLDSVTSLYGRTPNHDGPYEQAAVVGGMAGLYAGGLPNMMGDVPPGEDPVTWTTKLRRAYVFLKDAVKSNKRLRKDIAKAHQDLERANWRMGRVTTSHRNLLKDRNETEKKMLACAEEASVAKQELKQTLQDLEDSDDVWRPPMFQVRSQLRKAIAEKDAAVMELESARGEPAKLQEHVAQLEDDKHSLEGQLAAARSESENLQQQLKQAKAREDEVSQQNQTLKQASDDFQAQLQIQEEHGQSLEMKVADLRKEAQQANKHALELNGLLEKKDEDLEQKQAELSELQRDNLELEGMLKEMKELEDQFHEQYKLDSAEHKAELKEQIALRRKVQAALQEETQKRKAVEAELEQLKAQRPTVSAAEHNSSLEKSSLQAPPSILQTPKDHGTAVMKEVPAPSAQDQDRHQSAHVSSGETRYQTMAIPNTAAMPPPQASGTPSRPESEESSGTPSRKRSRNSEQVDDEELARETKRRSASPRKRNSTVSSATTTMAVGNANTNGVPILDLDNVPILQRPDAPAPTPRVRRASRIPTATPSTALRRSTRTTAQPQSYSEASLRRSASPTKATEKGNGAKGAKRR